MTAKLSHSTKETKMARQQINSGTVANDGSGDTLREGARKINENFIELYSKQLPIQTGNSGRFLQTNGTQILWAPVNIVNIPGNAGTVTNGVYTTGNYDDPSWINSLNGNKLTGTVVATNGVVTTGTYSDPSWITSLSVDKITGTIVADNGVVTTGSYVNPSWIVSLEGSKLTGTVVATNGLVSTGLYVDPDWIVSLDGGKIINAVLTTGSYNDPSWINSISGSKVAGNITGNAGTVTNGVYTTGSYADPNWITSLSPTKVLPSQTDNSGKFLTTNGSTLSWTSILNSFDQSLNTSDDVAFTSVTSDNFSTNNILISDNTISTTNSNSDLELQASGSGSVNISSAVIRIKNLPALEIAELAPSNGDIIYDTDTNKFRGYAGGAWVDLH